MFDQRQSFRNVRLIDPEDPDYLGFVRRMADRRPPKVGTSQRSAGEYLGGLVELCVRHWLGKQVLLEKDRILAWEQRLNNGRVGPMYRELDAVWKIDNESLCLFEMKLTYGDNMRNGVGIRQLNTAADALFTDPRWHYVLKRLVYIETERVPVLEDMPVVEPQDEYSEIGVIWVPVESVEEAAVELAIELPDNWKEPESREGTVVLDPEQEEWRRFATTDPKERPTDADTTEAEVAEETPIADSPLAEALKRAMEQ